MGWIPYDFRRMPFSILKGTLGTFSEFLISKITSCKSIMTFCTYIDVWFWTYMVNIWQGYVHEDSDAESNDNIDISAHALTGKL